MRQQFTATLSELMKADERLTILLGDIGVYGFRHVFANHPTRIYNIGILEQSTVGLASGLASGDSGASGKAGPGFREIRGLASGASGA